MPHSHKHLFARTFKAAPERLHFAAHSHHYWPDVTRDAHLAAWDRAAELADTKWEWLFGEVIPEFQRHLARTLGLGDGPLADGSSFAFATSTHELVFRAFTSMELARPARVLTTDAEFHSFRRQIDRLAESGQAEVTSVAAEPFDTLAERFAAALRGGQWDFVLCSHVLFDSGFVFDAAPQLLAEAAATGALAICDGYHGFMAVPTDWSAVADRVFYTSGGYKYAMSGEGACFMHCPPGIAPRPLYTGWFAGFDALAAPGSDRVPYPEHGGRFLGSTLDPSGILRLNATFELLEREGLDVATIHAHVGRLQARFLDGVEAGEAGPLSIAELIPGRSLARGRFLTFRRTDAGELQARLQAARVLTDRRDDRLRFGFAIYHDDEDVDRLLASLRAL
ncbi:aminotransferase class V-fold PLP-dependent enzyme [Engelhardtia mirabilis]|uniref:Isopenicillin N epimerase n=1 Tax=Engelhardtia mirabilis TaxID=2528011 RepID=A0A518BMS9_9BACT|nr:Isopenicillin N epimerase [Planctomycetes bacterium Pla133]QDV02615.1 Isopenicillin N epimerase [Planctomycetes bacterium Pla86]